MSGLLIGLAAGILELIFLNMLVTRITGKSGKPVFPLILSKVLVMALALALTIIIEPKQLVYCGTGIAGVLMGGSVILFLRNRKS